MNALAPVSPGSSSSRGGGPPGFAGPQFQTVGGLVSNLDRCNRCGRPRSAHGPDWACASARRPAHLLVTMVVATVVGLAGIGVLTATSMTSTTAGTIGASAFLAGLTVLIATLVVAGRD